MGLYRPECVNAKPGTPAPPYPTALYMITEAVARRTQLAHGALNRGGLSCAVGAFFDDNPKSALAFAIIEEVAAYNDSIRSETPRVRRNRVLRWLRWRLRVLEGKAK